MKFNDFSGLDIPEILINIMSYHIFYKVTTSTVILSCCSDPVPYYLSKGFIIVEKVEVFCKYTRTHSQSNQCFLLHDEYSPLVCKASIQSIVTKLDKIVITRYLYGKFLSISYDIRHVETITE